MIPMKKRVYTVPVAQEIELSNCSMICASIVIDNEETNTSGRTSTYKRDGWENGFWKN